MEHANGGMAGKVVLITGGTSGIGKAAATALARMGTQIVVTGRDRRRGEAAIKEIQRDSGNGKVSLLLADLAAQAEVRRLTEEFEERHHRLDVLVNNAGLIQDRRTLTPDGVETTLAVNHLAPFLLANLLLDKLKRSAPSRVVTVSSEAQRSGELDFNDLQNARRYRPFGAYGRSKLANIMFTYELAERLEGTGVTANCLHPGSVNTNFGKNSRSPTTLVFRALKPFMRTPERGADTLVYLAASQDVEGTTGRYLSDGREILSLPQSYEPSARQRLWRASEALTGLRVTD